MARNREILLPWDSQPPEASELSGASLRSDLFFERGGLFGRVGSGALTLYGAPALQATPYGIARVFAGVGESLASSNWPVLPDGTEYTYLVVFHRISASGDIEFLINGDNSSRAFQFRLEGSGAVTLIAFNTAVSIFSATGSVATAGLVHCAVAVVAQSGVRIYQNGAHTATSGAITGTIKGQSASDISLGNRLGQYLRGSIGQLTRWPFALDDETARALSGDPFGQLFAPRSIPVPVSAGGGPPTQALTNNLATTSAGISAPSLSLATTGNSATSAVGTVVPSLTVAETGNAATASSGIVTPAISLALSGNGATASAGSVGIGGTTQAVTGNAATVSTGAIAPSLTLALSGSGATASVGTVGVGGTTQALTGNAATTSVGTPVAAISLALAGNAATSSTGTVAPGLSATLTGNAVTTAAGTPVAALSLALDGNAATSAAGTVDIPGIIVPTANEATASAGTVSPGITVTLTGNGATTSVGSVSPAIALALSGLAGTSAAGIVIPGLTLALSGNGATASAGSAIPATGNISVALTGNAATAYAGSFGIGGINSDWWMYSVPADDLSFSVAANPLAYRVGV